jgi:zinc D-Ala-D-Ala carboxypeptidase
MSNLSAHFTLAEMTHSDTAIRKKISNLPGEDAIENLTRLCERMEEVRKLLGGKSIKVNSGYRGPALNKVIPGASKTSDHMLGLAVDFTCASFGTPRQICDTIFCSTIKFKQIICEGTWVHFAVGEDDEDDVCQYMDAKFGKGGKVTYDSKYGSGPKK